MTNLSYEHWRNMHVKSDRQSELDKLPKWMNEEMEKIIRKEYDDYLNNEILKKRMIIHDEVLESAIRAAYTVSGGTQWDAYPEEAKKDDREQMRAALHAAINAWPNKYASRWIDGTTIIILPLSKNNDL